MKPLELVTYPHAYPWDSDLYRVGSGVSVYGPAALAMKQLTDAELAAEYWRAKWTGEISQRKHPFMLTEANLEKIKTVERFMTLPHASESNYE